MTKLTAIERKHRPVFSGVLRYFPDALAEVAFCSWVGNEQHNPGEPLHWNRPKSSDHLDALIRHLMDAETFDEDGVRYHHIIDPKTGRSAGEVRSVTIIGPDATTTDGLSTSVFVLGPERGLELVERIGEVDAVIVRRDGKVLYSSGLAAPQAPPQNQPEK